MIHRFLLFRLLKGAYYGEPETGLKEYIKKLFVLAVLPVAYVRAEYDVLKNYFQEKLVDRYIYLLLISFYCTLNIF
jgi:hypothetical protein